MTTADGNVVGSATVIENGPTYLLRNIVLVAEGFQAGELPEFAQHAQNFADRLLSTSPFDEARCALNIFRIDVASNDSGADDPVECGGTGSKPATYFDASYCAYGGIHRAMSVDEGSVLNVVEQFVPQWNLIIVVVNSPIWGGTGGQIAKTSVSPGWENIAIHEMGHVLFGLADEYEYLQGCDSGETDRNEYGFLGIRFEPSEPNVTIATSKSGLKWGDLVAPSTLIPTTTPISDCTVCDPRPSPVPPGTVGTFEGAHTYHCKVYRPEFTCMMRFTGDPFCAVCRRRIRQTLDAYQVAGSRWIPGRFRRINDYALQQGFVGGYNNFHEADYGQGVVFGSILIKPWAADRRDVSAAELGNPSSLEARFRAVYDYAVANGYVGGYPTFHEADFGQGLVYGCILIKPGTADWQDVRAADLGNPNDLPARFRAVYDYAVAKGYVGGFPNFHEANYGQGVVYGCILIKPSAAEWRDVLIRDLCAPSRKLNDAQFLDQTASSTMRAGRSQQVVVKMRNAGTATWISSNGYNLGSQSPQDNTIWGLNRVPLSKPVLPGEIATFNFTVTPPQTLGHRDFQWRMVQDVVEWFGDFTPAISVNVVQPRLGVWVEPQGTLPLKKPVQITIHCVDVDTGAQVAGTVIIDPPGTTTPPLLQFNTNTPFTVTFNCMPAGGTKGGPVDEWVCTEGRVTAPGYAPSAIPFDVAEPY